MVTWLQLPLSFPSRRTLLQSARLSSLHERLQLRARCSRPNYADRTEVAQPRFKPTLRIVTRSRRLNKTLSTLSSRQCNGRTTSPATRPQASRETLEWSASCKAPRTKHHWCGRTLRCMEGGKIWISRTFIVKLWWECSETSNCCGSWKVGPQSPRTPTGTAQFYR